MNKKGRVTSDWLSSSQYDFSGHTRLAQLPLKQICPCLHIWCTGPRGQFKLSRGDIMSSVLLRTAVCAAGYLTNGLRKCHLLDICANFLLIAKGALLEKSSSVNN